MIEQKFDLKICRVRLKFISQWRTSLLKGYVTNATAVLIF